MAHLGNIGLGPARPRVRFSPAHSSRCSTRFADQAVIAIENARSSKSLSSATPSSGEYNHQVNEALEQQTAFGEVLRIIASSPANAEPVLDALGERRAV